MSIGHIRGDEIEISQANYTVKTALVSRASSGELIAAVTGKSIRVVSAALMVASSVTVRLDTAGNPLTGAMSMIVGVPLALPVNPFGWVKTVAGEALNVTLGSAVQISGVIHYIEV